jgi:hypothetical protein
LTIPLQQISQIVIMLAQNKAPTVSPPENTPEPSPNRPLGELFAPVQTPAEQDFDRLVYLLAAN